MLQDADSHAVIAVKDLGAAKGFYVDTLGMKIQQEDQNGAMLKSGNTKFLLYTSEFAGTNQATTAFWEVADIESTVAALNAAGITFQHYDDMEGVTREGDVHVLGPAKAAWFKDPDGNILSVSTPT